MGLLNRLFGRGDNDEIISDLQDKIISLETVVSKSATMDIDYASDGNYYSWSSNSTDKSYANNYTVFRGVSLLSDMVSQLPMRLYRGEQELPIDHVFANGFSMATPNPKMSLSELIYKSCVYYFFRGEYINRIIDDGVFRLNVVNPKNLTRNMDGSWWFNGGYNLNITIQDEQLIYNQLFNPTVTNNNTTLDRGLSPIDVVKEELSSDSAAGEYITKFFENFTQIGGTLTNKEGSATVEDMNRVVTQWNAHHASKSKAWKTVGLPKGLEYKELSQTMREMQFLESRKDIRDKVLAVLGIHKSLLGETDSINRAVAEEATRQVWVQTLKPKAIRIQEKYNQQLFNRHFPGYHIKFDFSEIKELQDNMESILKQAVEFKKLGYTTNEINEHFKLGMEDITDPEGDQRYIPIYLRTLDQLTIQPIAPEPKVPAKDVLDTLNKVFEPEDKTFGETYRQYYLKKRQPLETKFTSKLKRYLFEQRKEVLKIISEAKHPHNITNNLSPFFNSENQRIKKTTEPLYVEGAELGTEIVDSQFKIVSNVTNKDWIEEEIVMSRVNKITGVNDTIYKQIKINLYEGLKAGESTYLIAKRIKNVYNMASTRAKTISRTETGGIINDSTAMEYKKKGVKRITWCGGTRELHARVNGSTVDYGEEFSNGLKWPGDSTGSRSTAENLVNCRCAFYAVID